MSKYTVYLFLKLCDLTKKMEYFTIFLQLTTFLVKITKDKYKNRFDRKKSYFLITCFL